jgi:hypothetical protein
MRISELSYLESLDDSVNIKGGNSFLSFQEVNVANISQTAIAISFDGNAIATNSAMIVESNSINFFPGT